MDKETKALINFYKNQIKDLEDKNKEKQDKLDKIENYVNKKKLYEIKKEYFLPTSTTTQANYKLYCTDEIARYNILQIIKGEDK